MTEPLDMISIRLQDFDLTTEVKALQAGDARVGAVCCFVGTCVIETISNLSSHLRWSTTLA